MSVESFPNKNKAPFSALGFDFGTQRIGVAFGQSLIGTAVPVAIIKARDGIPNWDELAALIDKWCPDMFVVGLPFNMDGSDSELLLRANKFAKRLNGKYHKPCYGMDERLSSVAAHEQVAASGHRSKQDMPIDDIAAQIILEDWFAEFKRQN
ncbi:MAG: Holliday junction resolvase RuvX [SAR86 cluster bacterium]|uniref:Putative pre-16S rRNA nuclease n=1 Tax=SAR86 cluster bacterium TaxID=2030880 RepID=A0A2A4MR47_9GAMM|nr:MAG: Holliday junction resolvase RuvX [SAR86 cluster bacterium]